MKENRNRIVVVIVIVVLLLIGVGCAVSYEGYTKKKEYIMDRVIHRFFLPDGVWYDFVTGKKFPGGKEYISFFKDEDYPVFAKTGAIIPLAVLDEDNLNKLADACYEQEIFNIENLMGLFN